MKKLVSLILALCMACILIPATAEDVTGLWYMVEMITNGVSINPAEMGINWTMELSEDGAGSRMMLDLVIIDDLDAIAQYYGPPYYGFANP